MIKWFASLLSHLGHLFLSLFVEIRSDGIKLIEDKKTWGTLFLIAALVVPFVVPLPFEALGSIALVGVALHLGVPLSTSTPFASTLGSLGLLDLVTNYSNKGDPARFFGAVFLIASLVHVFSPIWGGAFQLAYFWVMAGVGLLLLFGAAIFGDKAAVSTSQ